AWNDEYIPSIPRALFNSFTVAGLSSLLCTYCSALTAYGIHVYDFKLKKPAFTFIMVIMTIPTQVSAVGFIQLLYKIDDNAATVKLLKRARGIEGIDSSFHAVIKFLKKFSLGKASKPDWSCALERVAFIISI
ncbi:MAG: hypothetical protein IJX15_09185, partial [Ruminiclostridium sp.]|nr:hypothetical protein [Ruminiclostridium sp.]